MYLYVMQACGNGPVKIGVARDVRKRLESMHTDCPLPLRIVTYGPGTFTDERMIHERLKRAGGEADPADTFGISVSQLEDPVSSNKARSSQEAARLRSDDFRCGTLRKGKPTRPGRVPLHQPPGLPLVEVHAETAEPQGHQHCHQNCALS